MHDVRFRRRVGERVETILVRVADGTTVLAAARGADLPIAHACDGGALCGRCGVRVLDGPGSLSPETEEEEHTRRRSRVPQGLRLACQSRIRGPVSITTTYW